MSSRSWPWGNARGGGWVSGTRICNEQQGTDTRQGHPVRAPHHLIPWIESSADMEAFPEPFTTRHVYTPTSSRLTSWISRTCTPFFSDIDTRALGCRGTSPCGWQEGSWVRETCLLHGTLQAWLGWTPGLGSTILRSGLCQCAQRAVFGQSMGPDSRSVCAVWRCQVWLRAGV